MHAILQKHQLRPATQPSGSRDGKPARSSLPAPAPTVQTLLSSRAPPPPHTSHHRRQQQLLPPTGLPPVSSADNRLQSNTIGDSSRGRMLTSGSGRRYYVATVEELLQPNASRFAPRTVEPAAAVHAAASTVGSRPPPHTTTSSRSAANSEVQRCDSGIPRMHEADDAFLQQQHHNSLASEASAALVDNGAAITNSRSGGGSLHHKLAEELARLTRWQVTPHEEGSESENPPPLQQPLGALFNASLSARNSAHQQRSQLSSRGTNSGAGRIVQTPNEAGASFPEATSSRGRVGSSLEGSMRGGGGCVGKSQPPPSVPSQGGGKQRRFSQWAAFAGEASVDELHKLLKVVIVQLLHAGGGAGQYQHQTAPPPAPPSSLSSSYQQQQQWPNHNNRVDSAWSPRLGVGGGCNTNSSSNHAASKVFHQLCATFAEATGTAAPPALRNPPPHLEQPTQRPGPTAACGGAPSEDQRQQGEEGVTTPVDDPSDDVSWQASPRPASSSHPPAIPRFVHVSAGGGTASPPRFGDYRSGEQDWMHADDAVVFRQLAILRRERDESRREVEELRAELHRRTAL